MANNANATKKRGEYNFSAAPTTTTAAAKPAKKAKKKSAKTSSAAKATNKAVKSATSSARNTIDLGLASISRTTSNAARQTANTVNDSVDRQSKAVRGAFANASGNAKQLSERVGTFGREITSNLSNAANRASRTANSTIELSRENATALSESFAAAAKSWKKASSELTAQANSRFAENVEAARKALSSRSISELFELTNAQARRNIEAAVQGATKFSETLAETAALALEPINEQAAKNSKKIAEIIA